MPDRSEPGSGLPPTHHLKALGNDAGLGRRLAWLGIVLLAGLVALIFGPRSVWWLMAYPLLIVCALAALSFAAVLLIRRF